MQVFHRVSELSVFQQELQDKGYSLGFVATMGALHEGHLTLLRQANKDNEASIVSIFVNPTQFNNPEDLDKYPRRTDEDLELLKTEGATAVFMPSVEEMYTLETFVAHFYTTDNIAINSINSRVPSEHTTLAEGTLHIILTVLRR